MAVTGPYDRALKGYTGLSTDTKPTVGVKIGSEIYETDTGKTYIYTGSAWVEGGRQS